MTYLFACNSYSPTLSAAALKAIFLKMSLPTMLLQNRGSKPYLDAYFPSLMLC